MWKCASKGIKSIFCKGQLPHNNVTTRETRNDKSVNCFLKLTPQLFGNFNRSYGGCKNGPKEKERENPKKDQHYCLNDFHENIFTYAGWTGLLAIAWSLFQPIAHGNALFNQASSEKCVFNTFSRYTKSECRRLLYYFNAPALKSILPIVEAKKSKNKCQTSHFDRNSEDNESNLQGLELAHNKVLGSLSNILGAECMKKGEYLEAFSHFNEGAKLSNPTAFFNLGICHEMGMGTEKDFKKAAEMYRKASDLGHATATYNLGVFYVHGLGDLKTDLDEARKLFQVAASLGQPNAIHALALEKKSEKVNHSVNNIPPDITKSSAKQKTDRIEAFDFLFNMLNDRNSTQVYEKYSSFDDSGVLDLVV